MTLQLGGGRWVRIKEELTYREEGALRGVGVRRVMVEGKEDPDYVVDIGVRNLARMKMWLIGWNARDKNGAPIPCEAWAIDELKPAQADEILDAIEAHQAELAARPNGIPSPETRSS